VLLVNSRVPAGDASFGPGRQFPLRIWFSSVMGLGGLASLCTLFLRNLLEEFKLESPRVVCRFGVSRAWASGEYRLSTGTKVVVS